MRTSRFLRTPVIKNGKTKRVTVLPSDMEIFSVLARYPYLNRDWIAALTKRSPDALKLRLRELWRDSSCYIKIHDTQRQTPRRFLFERLAYHLDSGAIKLLSQQDIVIPPTAHSNLDHQMMVSQIMASFELGAVGNVQLFHWPQLVGSTSEEAQKSDRPFTHEVTYQYRHDTHTSRITPDGRPFALAVDQDDGAHHYYFAGFEADCGTEPIEFHDSQRSSIERKFCQYISFIESRRYRHYFNFLNIYIPFVFNNAKRVESALDLLQRLDTNPKFKKSFLFAVHSPEPSGALVEKPWLQITPEGIRQFYFGRR